MKCYDKHLVDVESVEIGRIAYNRRYNLSNGRKTTKKFILVLDG